MIEFFGVPLDTLMTILLVITCIIVGVVLLLAVTNRLFFKIGVRNITRRHLQMLLIVFALMLSTTLLSSVLATGDVMTAAVQSVAVYNLGNVDEIVEGGFGSLGTYRDRAYYTVLQQKDPSVAAVGAALHETNILLADQTSRQVRSQVSALAVLPGSEQGFGGMQDIQTKKHVSIAALKKDQVYLNQTVAQELNAKRGDILYLYSQRWPGKRYSMQVAGIVGNDGLVGDNPTILTQLQAFQTIENLPDRINQVFIANSGGGGVNGLALSDQVADHIQDKLPRFLHVTQVKQQGVQTSLKAGDIFSRIFSLFALFALAIGLLLIFLIFVLLAAERRAEMGMARAIGLQRRHLILMFLFEGTVYDLLASFIGLVAGIGVGVALVYFLGPVLARFNFPLKFSLQPRSLIVAYCLGVIFTFCSVALSSWLVSRMTVVEALRDQPEPVRVRLTFSELGARFLELGRDFSAGLARPTSSRLRLVRRILLEQLPDAVVDFVRDLTLLGLLPLLAGFLLLRLGLMQLDIIPFSLGLSCFVLGAGLLLQAFCKWIFAQRRQHSTVYSGRGIRAIEGSCIALMGIALVAYWALPFDVLAALGLPRFQGGIEVFFVAGVMMVLGAIWALMSNARVLAAPWLALSARFPGLYAMTKLASAYPLQRRFRTGLSIVMFSLVVFAMTVMAVITNAMQNTYVDINTQTGGYDIQATAYFKSLPDLHSSLIQHGINPADFSAIGVRSTTPVGVVQLSATTPRWSLYPAQVVSGSFLQGYGLHLTARARGFTSDAAIWQAMQTHPDYALIDSSSLPYNPANFQQVYDPSAPKAADAGEPATPPGIDAQQAFTMSGVYQGDTVFPATPVWIAGEQTLTATRLTIIGVVDNSDSAHFGLYVSRSAYSNASVGTGEDPANPQAESYYFKVAPGQDARALALALGSAYLDNGLETTVLVDAIWQARGPRILLSDVLLGVVGMTLLLGVAALALTGTRAVLERRQQIGMLRALGSSRRMVQGAFLLEAFLIGATGSVLGILLGLILARNIFAANFFEQYQTGLTFSIPWQQLWIIVGVAFLASLLGAVLPAWQAGKIAPAEALRYS